MILTLLVQVPWLPATVLVLAVLVGPLVVPVLSRHRVATSVLLVLVSPVLSVPVGGESIG